MSLTNKEQELINCVENFNTEWKCKIDEMNAIPAMFPKNGIQDEHLNWEDAEKKMRWSLWRETLMSNDGREITLYTYHVRWLYGKGRCRAGDTIKQTRIEIHKADDLSRYISIPKNRLEGEIKYGIPFKAGTNTLYLYLYMTGLVYKLVSCSKPNRPLIRES
jgi:hypothetical protein